MKSIKLALAGIAALAVLPAAAAAADPGHGRDRENAARACKALRASQPALFAATYGTQANAFGKCVSEWAKASRAARQAAEAACRPAGGKGKGKGRAPARCVDARTKAQLAARVQATRNAALACKTERDAIGATAFRNKYGTNPNKANAFGKCVSSMRAQGAQAGHVRATLTGPVGSGTFAAVLKVRRGELCYRLSTTGLTGITAAHIHVKPDPPGAIVVPLATPTTGSSRGCVNVAPALLQAILQNPGNYYVNVHTTAAPAGAISGDLRR